ncbi:UDP-N-acetylmuramoyl-L-alanyl-D-glutamate--2,6-diaminopimelate ligase [Alteribacter populi]|uniref:UDP-N-acetylmuramoyl-L-alanyl-D-glutamate--2, 6-diaminopimelate ligase n=1 Tax=Alteribacter populi TaxID=2011011 RepID=UPI000BBA7A32|nr:UDP-N-acetylmuramoyl-L-alanyl-D-glutamate--2,6-diaminopimelate ligase [Alteribacter populi]
MKLGHLVRNLTFEPHSSKEIADLEIIGIADNSLDVKEGFLFLAIKGYKVDGHHYIEEAIKQGAVIIVGEEDIVDLSVPYIKVKNSRKALGIIAKNFNGNPTKQKTMIGITGTNGKTTTSYLLRHILEDNGISCALIGTIHNIINGDVIKSKNTTPSSLTLYEMLAKSNDTVVIIEASSHGLSQNRLEGVAFDYCLFTNLTQDHLDYHGTMENYFTTKQLLFTKLKKQGLAIINKDDFWGEKLNRILQKQGINTFSVGQEHHCDLRMIEASTFEQPWVKVSEATETFIINSSMAGMHNLYNTVMAYVLVKQLLNNQERVLQSIQCFSGVPGRFELFEPKHGSTVIVDYAHTADGILNCLKTAKASRAKKITHVFGFRGDRDILKRREMMEISMELSDEFILTIDDLNSVPLQNMMEALDAMNEDFGNGKGSITPDRTLAIKQAIDQSEPGDWIVITGKGHEDYQQEFALPTLSDMETVKYINMEHS